MARIELRDAFFRIIDGHTNTGEVNGSPVDGDSSFAIDTLGVAELLPIGSRIFISGATARRTISDTEAGSVYTVDVGAASAGGWTIKVGAHATSGTIAYNAIASAIKTAITATGVASADVTVTVAMTVATITFTGSLRHVVTPIIATAVGLTDGTLTKTTIHPGAVSYGITFTPALSTADGIPADNAVITFAGRVVEVKIGTGNLTYTENKEYTYELDRGNLDTVREGDKVPMDVTIDYVWDFITATAGANPTVEDALKQRGEASDWVTTSTDPCEPYCIDLEVEHVAPCAEESEITTFPMFRYEKLQHDIEKAQISVTGRCNVTDAIQVRV